MPLCHKVTSKDADIQINDHTSYWCMGSFINIVAVSFIITGHMLRD